MSRTQAIAGARRGFALLAAAAAATFPRHFAREFGAVLQTASDCADWKNSDQARNSWSHAVAELISGSMILLVKAHLKRKLEGGPAGSRVVVDWAPKNSLYNENACSESERNIACMCLLRLIANRAADPFKTGRGTYAISVLQPTFSSFTLSSAHACLLRLIDYPATQLHVTCVCALAFQPCSAESAKNPWRSLAGV